MVYSVLSKRHSLGGLCRFTICSRSYLIFRFSKKKTGCQPSNRVTILSLHESTNKLSTPPPLSILIIDDSANMNIGAHRCDVPCSTTQSKKAAWTGWTDLRQSNPSTTATPAPTTEGTRPPTESQLIWQLSHGCPSFFIETSLTSLFHILHTPDDPLHVYPSSRFMKNLAAEGLARSALWGGKPLLSG